MYHKLLNLYIFMLIFTFVNKTFSPIIDLRYITVLIGACLLILSVQSKLRISKMNLTVGLIYVLVNILSTILYYSENSSYIGNTTNTLILSHLNNLLLLFVLLFNFKKIKLEFFLKVYYFSLIFLIIGVFLDLLNIPIHKITIYDSAEIVNDPTRPSGWIFRPNDVPLVTFPYLILIFATNQKGKYSKFITLLPLLILPQSKTFFVIFIIGIMYLFFIKKPKLTIATICILIINLMVIFKDKIIAMLLLQTMSFRYAIWEMAINKIPDSILFGYGIGGSRYFSLPLQYGTIHNSYLAVLGESGVIGFTCYLIMILSTLKLKNVYFRVGWIWMLLYGMTQEYTFSVQILIFYFMIFNFIKDKSIVNMEDQTKGSKNLISV